MKRQILTVANIFVFLILAILLLGFQSSLWLQLFGHFPAPQTWIPIFVYWILYRSAREGMLMTYLLALTISSSTAFALGYLLFVLGLLYLLVKAFKMRIYYPGPLFFMVVVGGCTLLFPFMHISISWMFENNPIKYPLIFTWIISSLMTMLFGLILYNLFIWIDKVTHKDLTPELGGEFV